MGKNKGTNKQLEKSRADIENKEFISKDGFKCKLLDYRGYGDLDIIFEDGYILTLSKTTLLRQSFVRHDIIKDIEENYLGKEKISKNGSAYKILRIENINKHNMVFIQFLEEDIERGYPPIKIIHNEVNNFFNKNTAIGMSFKNKRGVSCKVIEYRKSVDVTIEFDNGEKDVTSMCSLKKGLFSKPSEKSKNIDNHKRELEGRRFVNLKNEAFIVLEYINAHNVRIKFELDGVEISTSSINIRNLKVSHPKTNIHRDLKTEYIGAEFVNRQGESCICTEYINTKTVKVLFSNGELGTYVLGNLVRGEFSKPSDKRGVDTYKSKITGNEYTSNFGEKVIVIEYINSRKVICKFDDETISEFRLCKLKSGKFAHPNRSHMNHEYIKEKTIGTIFINSLGMKATCVDYIDSHTLVCEFEDGAKIINTKRNLINKSFSHPLINNLNKKDSFVVYRLKNKQGEILYIGRSVQFESRLYQHFSRHIHEENKSWYFEVEYVDYCECVDSSDMINTENYLINRLSPKGNRKIDRFDIDKCNELYDSISWIEYDIKNLDIYKVNVLNKNY